ncbi:hypothetical protein CALCODRAFT_533995, partial [Calocera cornea HHB12733]
LFIFESLPIDFDIALAQISVQAALEDVRHLLRVVILACSIRGKQLCSLLVVVLAPQLRNELQVLVQLSRLAVLQAPLVAVGTLLELSKKPSVSHARVYTEMIADLLCFRYELDALGDLGEGREG